MKATFTILGICIAMTVMAQTDPIPLSYDIGKFKITPKQDQAITARFNQLDPNKTYLVHISGSADFLGGAENNITLSNKRVKFAEYHLLQHYSQHRLIIKLDSKGEMNATGYSQTSKGIQEHRMVYIHIQEYDRNISISDTGNMGFDRVIATSGAARAEQLNNIPQSISTQQSFGGYKATQTNLVATSPLEQKDIIGQSETAQIERAKEEARIEQATRNITPTSQTKISIESETHTNDANTLNSRNHQANGDGELRKFDGEGTFAVGEKLLLSDMNFRPGSHYLRPSSIPSLRKLIDVLEDNPNLEIEIRGHICCHPDYSIHPDGFDREAGNHKLSYNRAQNIKEYLEKNGIAASRISAVGMGAKERLVYPEETDEDRIKNRRVEIIIRKI